MPDCRIRINIQLGHRVKVVEKQNQKLGILTEGTVATILTNSPQHPHGIKVRLNERGVIGRVKEVLGTDSVESAKP